MFLAWSLEFVYMHNHEIKVSANISSENGKKDVYITGEVLDLFWDCLDEDILDNEFQEQIENDLEEVSKLEKHVILVN